MGVLSLSIGNPLLQSIGTDYAVDTIICNADCTKTIVILLRTGNNISYRIIFNIFNY